MPLLKNYLKIFLRFEVLATFGVAIFLSEKHLMNYE